VGRNGGANSVQYDQPVVGRSRIRVLQTSSSGVSEYSDALTDRWHLADSKRRGLGDIRAELRMELSHVVCKKGGLVAGAGNRDVSEAGVEEVRMNAGVGIYQDALCGKALRAVTGDCISVVKMAMLFCVEFDPAIVVKTSGNYSPRCDGLDDGKVAIRDTERLVRRGELDAVPRRKFLQYFPINANAGEPSRIVIG